MIDLNEMSKRALETSNKRMANGAHMTGDPLKHAAEELVEAVEAREVYQSGDCFIWERLFHYSEELADVITCILIAAAEAGIDIEKALRYVEEKNAARAEKKGDKL